MITVNGNVFYGSSNSITIINGQVVGGNRGTGGRGPVVTQERPTDSFDSIVLSGPIDLKVDANEKARRVAVQTQENLQSHVDTYVKERTLYIAPKGNFSTSGHNPTVLVDLDTLGKLTAMGSGETSLQDVEGKSLQVSLEGSGTIKAAGKVDDLSVEVVGSGRYSGRNLATRRAEVSITGSGDAVVAAHEELHADITGSGEITYLGTPRIRKSITGSGSVEAY